MAVIYLVDIDEVPDFNKVSLSLSWKVMLLTLLPSRCTSFMTELQ